MKTTQQLQSHIRQTKQAVLLVNTHSRKGELLLDAAREQLQAQGYKFTKVFAIKKPADIERTIAEVLALKPELLIVGSGDGTLSTVVDHLAYTDTILGYLPLGTTNNFGRSLHIPTDLDAAIDVIVNGKVAEVDLGKVNDDYFGNMTSMGVSVKVASDVPGVLKRRLGRLAYAVYAVKSFLSHKPFRVELQTGNSSHFFYTHQFCIANGSMHAGKPIAADISIDNGMLVAYALGHKSRLSTAIATINHARSSNEKMRHKNLITGTKFTVITSPAQPMEIDGEVRLSDASGVLQFDIAANALKILVPHQFIDQ